MTTQEIKKTALYKALIDLDTTYDTWPYDYHLEKIEKALGVKFIVYESKDMYHLVSKWNPLVSRMWGKKVIKFVPLEHEGNTEYEVGEMKEANKIPYKWRRISSTSI